MGKHQEEHQVSLQFAAEPNPKRTPTIPWNKSLGQCLADPRAANWQALYMACVLWAALKGRHNSKVELLILGEVATTPLNKTLITACRHLRKWQVRATPSLPVPGDWHIAWPSTSQKDYPLMRLIPKCIDVPGLSTHSHSSFQPTLPCDDGPQLLFLGWQLITPPFHNPVNSQNKPELTLSGSQEAAVTRNHPSH